MRNSIDYASFKQIFSQTMQSIEKMAQLEK
jgi:hypothetical protein